MKNRKTLLTFLSIAVVLVALLGFSSCNLQHTHSFSEWETVAEPTCSSFGLQKHTCECSYTEYKTTAALQHTPVTDAAIDATCTAGGKTEGSHCDVCKAVLVAQTSTAPVAHSFSEWETVTEPTCSSFGVQKHTCECSYTEYKTTAALQHTPVTDAAIDATCTTDGKTEGSHCGTCGTILTVQNTVRAFGHNCDNVTVLTEADCNSLGCKRFSCSNAGCLYYYDESYSKNELSAPEIMESAVGYVGYLKTYAPNDMLVKDSTAFVIAADGKILTTYAALDDAYYATFTLGDKTYNVIEILAYDKNINLAVLKIDATDLTCATLCDSAPVTAESVYAIGNALGLSLSINAGNVSNASLNSGDTIYIQHDAVLMSGYGGSPLVNRFGEVIGINLGYYQDENFRLAVPITQLSALNYDNPISMEENFNLTYTTKEYLSDWIMAFATSVNSGSYYFEHTSSQFAFAFGYNQSADYIFVEGVIKLQGGYQVRIHIPLEMLYDGTYQYQAMYTDGTFRSEICGYFDPATYADASAADSFMLTYDTFYGRYWSEMNVMDACSYAAYETIGWLSYCLDTYFFDINLKDTFGFSSVSYERDDSALGKLNEFVKKNGALDAESGAYSIVMSQTLTSANLVYSVSYYPVSETMASKTIVTVYCTTDVGEVYSVSITLNPNETGNLIEMFSGLLNGTEFVEQNNAWGYIDANSFTDTSEITCYVFQGYEEYEDLILAYYSSLIPYLLDWTNYIMSNVGAGLSIRDLGFLFYFLQ